MEVGINNMNSNLQQRLYWSISRPLKYMGLTIDEMIVTIGGIGIAVFVLMDGSLKLSLFFFVATFVACYSLKKYKRVSQYFKLKSFLVANNIMPAPPSHPKILGKARVGK